MLLAMHLSSHQVLTRLLKLDPAWTLEQMWEKGQRAWGARDTLGMTPACYLGDLFVDPKQRAGGVGKQLIDWLVEEMKRRGWCRLYWHTRLNNYRARGLYDKFTPHSDFVSYTVYPEA